MKPFVLVYLSVAFLSVFLASQSYAAEVKIVDSLGLTRAVKEVKNIGKVEVVVKNADGSTPAEAIALTNVDGLAADLQAYPEFGGRFTFSHVSGGTWQVKTPKKAQVTEVKILE